MRVAFKDMPIGTFFAVSPGDRIPKTAWNAWVWEKTSNDAVNNCKNLDGGVSSAWHGSGFYLIDVEESIP